MSLSWCGRSEASRSLRGIHKKRECETRMTCALGKLSPTSPHLSPLAIRAGATIQHSGSTRLGELDSEILPLFVWQQILPHSLRRALQSGQSRVEIGAWCGCRMAHDFLREDRVRLNIGGPMGQRLHFQRRLTPAVVLTGDGVNAVVVVGWPGKRLLTE